MKAARRSSRRPTGAIGSAPPAAPGRVPRRPRRDEERERAIDEELVRSRDDAERAAEDPLGRGTSACRGGSPSAAWTRALKRLGYESAVANRLRGVLAVRPRRQPVLAQAAAQPVHLQPAGARPPLLVRPAAARRRVVMTLPFPGDVGVAIVCHNNLDKLELTLPSLDAAGCPHAAMLIVDVASTDGTVAWLRERLSGRSRDARSIATTARARGATSASARRRSHTCS